MLLDGLARNADLLIRSCTYHTLAVVRACGAATSRDQVSFPCTCRGIASHLIPGTGPKTTRIRTSDTVWAKYTVLVLEPEAGRMRLYAFLNHRPRPRAVCLPRSLLPIFHSFSRSITIDVHCSNDKTSSSSRYIIQHLRGMT